MRKIKLFIDAHIFDGKPQGSVTFISGIYSELIKDERFQVFVGSSNKRLAEEYLGSDNFVHVQYNEHSKIKRLLFTIPRILKENDIDFAHFQYISPIFKSCKYIVTIHDLLFLEFPTNFPLSYRIKNTILFYLSGKRANIITTVSDYSKKSIHYYFKIPLDNIYITPNAVVQQDAIPVPIDELLNRKFLLYVSRIEPRKNQALLIKVWRELGLFKQNIDLVLVGVEDLIDKNFNDELYKLSIEEKDHFHWLNNISNNELSWLYKNCILFVFPSIAEGFGIPPLEAAVSGAKVLCSNTTAMREFDFWGNFQFDPNNYDDFKNSLQFAIENDFNHEKAISSIMKKYNWKKIAADFGDLIVDKMN